MIEILVETLASFLSSIFTQQAAEKKISLKKLFWLLFFTLLTVMTAMEGSCFFNENCIAFSWKFVGLEFITCVGFAFFIVGLIKLSFWFFAKKS